MGKRSKSLQKSAFFKFDVGLGKKKKDTDTTRPKISSNRITVLPGFLSQGVKAVTFKNQEVEENQRKENILKEDLHGLFLNNLVESSSLRRSTRISKRNLVNYAEITPKKRKFSNKIKLESEGSSQFEGPNKTENPPFVEENKEKSTKSLFKQIISSQTVSNSIHFLKTFFSNKNSSDIQEFNRNVLNKIEINFKVDVAQSVREKIVVEIGRVNDILSGKVDPYSMSTFFKLAQEHMEDAEHQVPEFLFSSRDWQFATPPSQKLNITFYEESAIQPAILCKDETGRNIYQLKREIDSNLINHINPNNIEVDNRYMEQIAEFDQENCPIGSFNLNIKKSGERKKEDFDFKPKFFNKYLMEHLTTIQMRPKKTVKRLRFAESFAKSQMALEFSKPSTSTVFDPLAMETSELDFTNCESPKSRFKTVPKVDIFENMES